MYKPIQVKEETKKEMDILKAEGRFTSFEDLIIEMISLYKQEKKCKGNME